jgi:hypothetical protein
MNGTGEAPAPGDQQAIHDPVILRAAADPTGLIRCWGSYESDSSDSAEPRP